MTCVSFILGGVPPSRWVVNFDFDLLDGLVLASALGAHAPFLVSINDYYYYYYLMTHAQATCFDFPGI